jgi:hypothetical protein
MLLRRSLCSCPASGEDALPLMGTILGKFTLDWLYAGWTQHTLTMEHKLLLAACLAGDGWRQGRASWTAGALSSWLDSALGAKGLDGHYIGKDREILAADLRAASFLSQGADGGFCFTHEILEDLFLAEFLSQNIAAGDSNALDGPAPRPAAALFLDALLARAELKPRRLCAFALSCRDGQWLEAAAGRLEGGRRTAPASVWSAGAA